jgi:methanethiol S-methyltransferase
MNTPLASALLLLFAIAVYGLVHSWLASFQAKSLARRFLGRPADHWYRLAYNVFAVVSFLPVLAVLAAMPGRTIYAIPRPWVLMTLAIQALAGAALLIGILQTGIWSFVGLEQAFSASTAQQPGKLVVSGLYRWVRHPLYTAGLVILWFAPLMTTSLLIFNLGLTAYLVIGAMFEERKLLREYGETYREYQRRTPMFLKLW